MGAGKAGRSRPGPQGGAGRGGGGRTAYDELFPAGTLEEMCGGVVPTDGQERAAAEWLGLLGRDRLADERRNHPKFAKVVLEEILGYPAMRADNECGNVDFEFRGGGGQALVCIEAKGTSTPDLFAAQRRARQEHSTPIRQTWDYMGRTGARYGICTNYRHFVLIMRDYGYRRCHAFDFEDVRGDPERLRAFIGVFSRGRLEAGFAERIKSRADEAERELTREFYDIYGRTRLMLVKEFEASGAVRADAVELAQTFLNRLIFVFFAQDAGLARSRTMFEDGVVDMLRGRLTTNTTRVWNYITGELFAGFNKGSDDPAIFGFNGGLFSEPIADSVSIRDRRAAGFFGKLGAGTGRGSWEFKSSVEAAVRRHDDTSPIIKNLLAMSSYDFQSQIRVSMLGHIFENSIGDLEELLGARTSRRKKEGVFYTPEYVTRYVCRSTIIPHLSRSGAARTPDELVDEYADDLPALEDRLRSIRILDPACGSGAFLIEAANTLLEVHEEVRARRGPAAGGGGAGRPTLEPGLADALARSVIRDNIYGIDINRQSVEITKLSMFLLTASLYERLPDLADNIRVGNSLVSRTNGEHATFAWEKEFPEVFPKKGMARDESAGGRPDFGFDIVIGNPPYVKHQDIQYKADIQLPRHSGLALPAGFKIDGTTDLSGYFFYHAFRYLRDGGILGYISSEAWMSSKYGRPLQQILLDNSSIREITRAEFNFFDDADTRAAIVVLSRGREGADGNTVRLNYARDKGELAAGRFGLSRPLRQGGIVQGNWTAHFKPALPRVKALAKTLGETGRITYGKITGNKGFFVLSKEDVDEYGIDEKYLCPTVSKSTPAGRLDARRATEWLLNVNVSKRDLRGRSDGRGALQYISDGERETTRPARGRDRKERPLPKGTAMRDRKFWYSLDLSGPPPIIMRRIVGESLDVWENDGRFFTTNTLANFAPDNPGHTRAFLAYFASSLYQHYMEAVGTEMGGGALSLDVFNYRESPVPDFDAMPRAAARRMADAWERYGRDPAANRPQIDGEVFAALGVGRRAAGSIAKGLGEMVRARQSKR